MKYINYDSEGYIIGYYDDNIHSTIPVSSVSATDAEWRDCVNHPGVRKVDLKTSKVTAHKRPPHTARRRREGMVVTRLQARLALLSKGLLDAVDEVISDPVTRLMWSESPTLRRTDPTVIGVGMALGLSDIQMDELFIAAHKL